MKATKVTYSRLFNTGDYNNQKLEIELEVGDGEKAADRHKQIHKGCCKHCPANHDRLNGCTDPETEDFKSWPKEVLAKEVVFVCTWRPTKLCKGICDMYQIDQAYLDQIHNK